MDELQNIKQRYETRKTNQASESNSSEELFSHFVTTEREKIYSSILTKNFKDRKNIKILEIGAGSGSNLNFFRTLGIPYHHLYANELLPDRVESLRKNHPEAHILPGNALDLNYRDEFDIVFQSTVFTSILDAPFKQLLAKKMWEMVKPGGIILWYDFTYNNPNNPDVRGIPVKEIKKLFLPTDLISFYRVTLAPPIGRRIGKLYTVINTLFPFLRTHIIAQILKSPKPTT